MADSLAWLDEPDVPRGTSPGGPAAAPDALSWLDEAPVPTDAGPAARRAAGGGGAQGSVPSDVDLGIEAPPAGAPPGWAAARPPRPIDLANNPQQGDWIAQGVLGGTLGAGAGALATPAARALGAGPGLARVVSGAAAGEVASDAQGGQPGVGALLGGGAAAAGNWFAGATGRAAERMARQYGKVEGVGEEARAGLREHTPEAIRETAVKYGLDKGSPRVAEVAAAKAVEIADGKVGDALGTLRSVGGDVDAQPLLNELDGLRARYGRGASAEARKLAAETTAFRDQIAAQAGKAGKIPPADLRQVADTLRGMPGKKATAEALDRVLETHVEAVAKKNPLAAEAAKQLAEGTREYRVLTTLRPIISRQATAETFRQGVAERLFTKPVQTIGGAAAHVAQAPFALADVALARLMSAGRVGAVTPAMVEQALRAGVRADVVAQIAKRSGSLSSMAHGAGEGAYQALGPIVMGKGSLLPHIGGEEHEHEGGAEE